ncbi:MAG: HAD-IA family hydrolase [Halioglobus sp.]
MIKLPENLKSVIFDLDGTLVDTAGEFVVVVQQLRAEHDLPPMDSELIRSNVSNGAKALVTLSLDRRETDDDFESKRLRLLEIYSTVLGSTATLYPGIQDLLDALHDRGISWGISTNKPRAYAEPLLERLSIQPEMGSLVCPDDVSNRKPHPEPLYLNCMQLDCAPHEAIYVGDHVRDIDAGRSAGIFTIAAAYGYIEAQDNPASWNANIIAKSSSELLGLILP